MLTFVVVVIENVSTNHICHMHSIFTVGKVVPLLLIPNKTLILIKITIFINFKNRNVSYYYIYHSINIVQKLFLLLIITNKTFILMKMIILINFKEQNVVCCYHRMNFINILMTHSSAKICIDAWHHVDKTFNSGHVLMISLLVCIIFWFLGSKYLNTGTYTILRYNFNTTVIQQINSNLYNTIKLLIVPLYKYKCYQLLSSTIAYVKHINSYSKLHIVSVSSNSTYNQILLKRYIIIFHATPQKCCIHIIMLYDLVKFSSFYTFTRLVTMIVLYYILFTTVIKVKFHFEVNNHVPQCIFHTGSKLKPTECQQYFIYVKMIYFQIFNKRKNGRDP